MSVFPIAVSTDADLFVAANFVSTTLNGAINAVTTTVILTDASSFPSAGYIVIDASTASKREVIKYTGKSTNTLTGVTRGADGTTATTHATLATVEQNFVANMHNAVKDEIIAIEDALFTETTEAPSGSVNGTNTTFTLTASPMAASLRVFINGVLMFSGSDYSRSGTTITMYVAPLLGDIIICIYIS